ncbi:epidermal growth factor receptor kinase substrate 8-like protein 3 [Dryobates pubescens]|uniref:epidermal growth factor receptor kinase substrate 8-like protein 3 n=1 Tax=Dryobates pubescens TaxID=118200 RepID=UPI0023B98B0F|nr:epidermal growth factor receptor kinase substrate 8-like protein 3 [Dryobates pubescens]
MGDSFYRRSTSLPRQDQDSSFLPQPNSFARPSGRSIYKQRRDYGQSLLQPQGDFQHHVEHLLTVPLGRDIRSAEHCLQRLRLLEAQGRVWGQDLLLQVKDQELVLSDVESKEELDSYPLGSIQDCWAVLDSCSYDSVLAIGVQERNPPGGCVLLFQCERPGAEQLKSSLEKILKQWKEEQRGQHGHRSSLEAPPERWGQVPEALEPPWSSPEPPRRPQEPPQRGPPSSVSSESSAGGLGGAPRSRGREWGGGQRSCDPPLSPGLPEPQQTPAGKAMTEADRDVEVLNHVLRDLELFVARLRRAETLPPVNDYRDFFQKVKYSFNLLARSRWQVQPSPSSLLHLIFTALSYVLEHCPSPSLAPAVESPLLLPAALELLEEALAPDAYGLWKSLGPAWNKSRAEYPRGEMVPSYIPAFSDGWMPPPLDQVQQRGVGSGTPPGWRDVADQVPPSLPAQSLAQALYEFQGRNPQELSIRVGDTLQVLEQQRKWWLVQDSRGQRGYVPSNLLQPLQQGQGGSPPSLLPDSPPEEVTAWLQDKGFSRLTVRCLGVLSGQQLLELRAEELRAACPEEWRRILFKLSPIKTSLGMAPRD